MIASMIASGPSPVGVVGLLPVVVVWWAAWKLSTYKTANKKEGITNDQTDRL